MDEQTILKENEVNPFFFGGFVVKARRKEIVELEQFIKQHLPTARIIYQRISRGYLYILTEADLKEETEDEP